MNSLLLTGYCLVLWLLAQTASAAMVVNGLTNRARYDGSVAFMVVAEAGFNTTARLDGQARTVGVQELQAGDNVIALEVPQASATSSELVMDLELVASGAV